ncbi:MAG TPA: SPFH domain-containing protein [Enhygromyxa sp.]|nr:SPFH domain-containing protein [Enhygromyxa sp.]
MQSFVKACKWFVLVSVGLLFLRGLLVDIVDLGNVGVRRSNVGGVVERDLGPGWRLEIVGLHKIIELPSTYQFLEFSGPNALEIRTKDNNIVTLDISVPYRITPGAGWEIVSAGNHVEDGQGGHRFQRLTRETTVGVLRQHLADLQSSDFYDTDRRVVVSNNALDILNEELGALHVEANAILIRAVYFRPEYESQLLQIQLNAQNKLLDGARKEVADMQQQLDNYQQRTRALASARQQDWVATLARVDRAYQVGFLTPEPDPEQGEDTTVSVEEFAARHTPGAARRQLAQLSAEQRAAMLIEVAETFGGKPEDYDKSGDAYLLGIKNIQAEALAYDQQIRAKADGVAARLEADGDAKIAEVVGNYESQVNQLFDSPAGRAFVAWQAAANVKFAEKLTFQSSDGIPSVLRLRDFARAFMGE